MIYRVSMTEEQQVDFFYQVKITSKLSWKDLSKICGVNDRSLRDWARAKYTPPQSIIIILSRKYHIDLPKEYKLLKPYWYVQKSARLGGLARYKLYGPPGSLESRRVGYIKAVKSGKFTTKKSVKSIKLSRNLAELVGILLGDGGLTNYQIKVTLDAKTDLVYSTYVARLLEKVFGERPAIYKRKNINVLDVSLSGVSYIKELERVGLKIGNKVRNQVSIPEWILKDKNYSRACLRGLMDTDGGVYSHNHSVGGNKYLNFGLTFTNASMPLILGAKRILEENSLKVFMPRERNLYIYSFKQIGQYFKIIGSSNNKHLERFRAYIDYSVKHKR